MLEGFLERIYSRRFSGIEEYRRQVWKVLIEDYLLSKLDGADAVLDLGCGYGEFINQFPARLRYAMDLNPGTRAQLHDEVRLIAQDCSEPWGIAPGTLDAVFTSNFLEHLPSKTALLSTLKEAATALRPGGLLVAVGPNIKYAPGRYWDFLDHHLPLTERSLAEACALAGLEPIEIVDRFLPLTMSDRRLQAPLALVKLYLRMRWIWPVFGRQFLVVCKKNGRSGHPRA